MLRFFENLFKLMRPSPFIINLIVLVDFLIHNDAKKLFLFIFLYIANFFNYLLKHYIFKPIMGNKKYKVLGTGTRPRGAKNCGYFIDNKSPTSYGMPSGHSQTVGIFSGYYISEALDRDHENKNVVIALLSILTLLVMYSRVKFGCHTVQQVIIGALIGLMMGYGFYQLA